MAGGNFGLEITSCVFGARVTNLVKLLVEQNNGGKTVGICVKCVHKLTGIAI